MAASPDIAPTLERIAARFNDSNPKIDGDTCAEARVSPRASADVANAFSGTGSSGAGPAPSVWIPDSSLWVEQARSGVAKAGAIATEAPSIALSPTVIAMPRPVASQLVRSGTGSGDVGWKTLLEQMNGAQPPRIGLPDPTGNTTGLAALLTVGQIIGTSPDARVRQVRVIRAISNGGGIGRTVQDVMDKLPQSADSAAIADGVTALPASEQAVWKYNASNPAVPLVAVYPSEGTMALDYPYVRTVPANDRRLTKSAERFLRELREDSSRDELEKDGFRSPDGAPGKALNPEAGFKPEPKLVPKPPEQAVAAALRSWQALSLPTRMLVLVDVSGSMATIVPGVGKTRLDVTVSAAQQGLGLFPDTAAIGLWKFSTQLSGNQDYQVLVPTGPLDEPVGSAPRRDALARGLTTLRVKKGGSTGLYDSILAAYTAQRKGYQPDRVNSVLVFTDGKNEDPTGGVSLSQLLAQLHAMDDARRPIPVFIVAFGPDVDIPSATKIAQVTHGKAFHATTPDAINQVFLDAFGQRTCRPNC